VQTEFAILGTTREHLGALCGEVRTHRVQSTHVGPKHALRVGQLALGALLPPADAEPTRGAGMKRVICNE